MLGVDEWPPGNRQPCTVSLGQCLVAVGPMRILCISFVGMKINLVNLSWDSKLIGGGELLKCGRQIRMRERVQGMSVGEVSRWDYHLKGSKRF